MLLGCGVLGMVILVMISNDHARWPNDAITCAFFYRISNNYNRVAGPNWYRLQGYMSYTHAHWEFLLSTALFFFIIRVQGSIKQQPDNV